MIGHDGDPFEVPVMTPVTRYFDTHRSEAAVATSLRGLDVPAELQLLSDYEFDGDDEVVTGIVAMGATIRNETAVEATSSIIQGNIFI